MAKYLVTIGTAELDGKFYKRGDIVESDLDLSGGRFELYIESVEDKPKRKRRTKAEIADEAQVEESNDE